MLAFHDTARWVGGGWMLFGLVFYVVYRKVFEGTTLTRRVSVTEKALTKQVPEVDYRNILVPVFGTELDDDIVATAGRLAAAEQEERTAKSTRPTLALVYVVEVPLTLPLDAELPPELEEEALRALERARDVGEEYEDVEGDSVGDDGPARSAPGSSRRRGAAAPRRSWSAAEPPSKIRGGATLGGIGAARPAEIGAATEYVLKKAPCRVLLTAPPEAPAEPEPEPAAAD